MKHLRCEFREEFPFLRQYSPEQFSAEEPERRWQALVVASGGRAQLEILPRNWPAHIGDVKNVSSASLL